MLQPLATQPHLQDSVVHNNKWLLWLSEKLEKIDLKVTPSVGNFILIHFPEGQKSAKAADALLSSKGYILRAVAGYGFPNSLRMTIGTEDENRGVVDTLQQFMKVSD